MKVRFLGAAQNVTGSKFVLEASGRRVMIDCGLYQERELKDRNWDDLPVDPASIEAVVLTHAHLDHCGYLPRLVKTGFRGKVFCTGPTAEITRITLADSGRIQEEDAAQKAARHRREGRKPAHPERPLYTAGDAEKVFPLLEKRPYDMEFEVVRGITARFHDAGHILGAAMVELTAGKNSETRKLVFSGDIGRWDKPILRDPTLVREADAVFVESTYGNRLHGPQEDAGEKLAGIINSTVEAGGNIVIPTFAIERAQEIIYRLARFLEEDRIPHLLVFLDSPMAIDVTEVFRRHTDFFDEPTRRLIDSGRSPFDFPLLHLARTAGESKSINRIRGSAVIMAGSGMCTGGRIKHHLAANISRPESTIAFVGYQARGTLGREILGGPGQVRILGRQYPVRARIESVSGFSAHADRDELFRWLDGFEKNPARKIFVVHGEEKASAEFAAALELKEAGEIIVPEYLSEHAL